MLKKLRNYINHHWYLIVIGLSVGLLPLIATKRLVIDPLSQKPIVIIVPSSIDPNNVQEKNLEQLVVNTSNDYRTIIQKDELAGIADLKKLVNSADYEEAWVYIPKERKWIEDGKSEINVNIDYNSGVIYAKEAPSSKKAIIDSALVSKLIEENNDLVFYHIHPLSQKIFNEAVEETKLKFKNLNVTKFKNVKYVTYALPSVEDISSMIITSCEFYQQNPKGRIIFKIGSPLGITQYGLPEEAKKRFSEMSNEDIKKTLEKDSEEYVITLEGSFNPLDKINEILNIHYNKDILSANFTPYPK